MNLEDCDSKLNIDKKSLGAGRTVTFPILSSNPHHYQHPPLLHPRVPQLLQLGRVEHSPRVQGLFSEEQGSQGSGQQGSLIEQPRVSHGEGQGRRGLGQQEDRLPLDPQQLEQISSSQQVLREHMVVRFCWVLVWLKYEHF
ncbi:hypothetical protein M8J76_004825 [Diaphorina citri]|nr:hypothetical protein M8J75_001497 [Diaphorina citri]KAI5736573.1 hypothetical protein M8J76_004825 [Diaphorina citri]KAI5743125.1 hypothetical protein M8J77_014853 [Diaphorina citri]